VNNVGIAVPVEVGRRSAARGVDWFPYLMMAPAMAAILVFSLAPTLYGVVVSLYFVQFIELQRFVGLRNYTQMLADPDFWNAFRASAVFTGGSVACEVVVATALALLANTRVRVRGVFRVVALLPWVASYIVVYLIFKWILNEDGLLNAALYLFGLPKVAWLNDPALATLSLIAVDTWRGAPYAMLLLLAGLQTIPAELYEAAMVDGAGWWRSFWSVTLPLMRLPFLIVLVLLTILNFNVLVAQLVLTGGGPAQTTEPLSLLMYNQAFRYSRMGPAASIAVFIFALNLVLAGVYTRLLRART